MKEIDYKKLCVEVKKVALEAGAFIAQEHETFSPDDIEYKGEQNLVSYVDKGAEEIVVAGLRRLLPEAGFITEEGTATYNEEQMKWIIDPLDGTTNFVHGLPPYCVSIGLMDGDEMVLGVVYEVTHKELFYAWQGSSAYMNGEKISTSEVKRMEDAIVAVGFSHQVVKELPKILEKMQWYQYHTNGIRRLGSATADLVYVACGRIDAYSQIKLASWDVAAGAFILQRAGGRVSDNSGGDDYIFGGEIVATNGYLFDEFLETVNS